MMMKMAILDVMPHINLNILDGGTGHIVHQQVQMAKYYTYSDPDDRNTYGYAYNEYLEDDDECSESESGGMWAFAGKDMCDEQVVEAVCW